MRKKKAMDWFANWISDLMVKFGLLSSPDDRKLAKELANFKEKHLQVLSSPTLPAQQMEYNGETNMRYMLYDIYI